MQTSSHWRKRNARGGCLRDILDCLKDVLTLGTHSEKDEAGAAGQGPGGGQWSPCPEPTCSSQAPLLPRGLGLSPPPASWLAGPLRGLLALLLLLSIKQVRTVCIIIVIVIIISRMYFLGMIEALQASCRQFEKCKWY